MGGSRSMSEDSVFIPEVKEPKMDAIRKTAISMESLNKDFQVCVTDMVYEGPEI